MTTIAAHHSPRPGFIWRLGATLATFFHPNRKGLLLCVFLPTFITLIYQMFIAADIHVSEGAFSIRRDQGTSSTELGLILPGLQYSGAAQDQLTVNAYIHSRDMVSALQKTIDLGAMFRNEKADALSRLPEKADNEELLEYYRSMVEITYDERAQISTLQVRAFTAEDAQKLNEAILTEAERFVNNLSARMHESGITFARTQLGKAEADLHRSNEALTNFRKIHKHFDPKEESEGVSLILKEIYGQIVAKKAQLEAMRGVMTSRNLEIRTLEREIAALQRQFDEQNSRLIQPGNLPVVLFEYSKLEAEQKFAAKRYELALTSLEAAQVEAGRQSVYLVEIGSPSYPDIATEPRHIYRIISVFFLSLAAYGMVLLIAASIHDHIRR